MTVRVFADHAAYRQALGGFARSATAVLTAHDSVAALSGEGEWPTRVEEAARAGAVVAVVDDPAAVSQEALDGLGALAMPIVLQRPRLRHDLAGAATSARGGSTVRAVVVECAGGEHERAGLLADAVGWAREFAGGELMLRSAEGTAGGLVCLLEGPGGLPVTVMFTGLDAPRAGGLVRVSVLGETRSEVSVDPVAGVADLDTVTAAGTLRAAPRHESSHRGALGRGIRAARAGDSGHDRPEGQPLDRPHDLDNLRHDSALAAEILDVAHRPR
ncbi:hypothetical protein C5B96_01625 [Subtercola sp. Z020]|uniref:hypothetical protein n=1 Tax=Subtercola sp. Z020 TaxID=2080582 RepID=UPI000CE747AD|nr:hypothetical protein [Subtercola sp. Z020]PPF89605.1 hypothetical protein C5B96_01625 [Subtercola sp. Z020]